MFGSTILDVAIGLALIYLLLSLINTVLTEFIAGLLNLRATNLENGIRSLLNDPNGTGLTRVFYDHPLIKGLSKDDSKPSYIPARNFALALLDMIAPAKPAAEPQTVNQIRASISAMSPAYDGLKHKMLLMIDDAQANVSAARENVEKMFDETMERVTGWYKRDAQKIVLVLAIGIAVAANADTLSITSTLYRDPALRAGLVAAAEQAVKQQESKGAKNEEELKGKAAQEMIATINKDLEKISFPLGWERLPANNSELSHKKTFFTWLYTFFGWALTALAISLGAPFWFDILNKFINIRSAGAKPDGKKK